MTIRLACEQDIPDLLRLLYQVGEVHHRIRPDLFRPGAVKYTEAELKQLLLDKNSPIFVLTEGDALLAYCFCQLRDHRGSTVMTDRLELYIDDLCVEESCRGRGLARALYRGVCLWAKSIGCGFVTLNVWQGNDNAQRFYEKMGMRPRSITMEHPLEDTTC